MFALYRFALILAAAAYVTTSSASPPLPDDGYPTGATTPEGAVCDYARALILRDVTLFERVVLPPFGSGESRVQYENYLTEMKFAISEENKHPTDQRHQEISRVFAARSLSKPNLTSYIRATFNFADVKFVDIAVVGISKMRIPVIKDNTGQWRVHPAPEIHPSLFDGLDRESPSTEEVMRKGARPAQPLGLSGVYKVEHENGYLSIRFDGDRCFLSGGPPGKFVENVETKCLRKENLLYIGPPVAVTKTEQMTRNVWVAYTIVDDRLESSHVEDMDNGEVFYKERNKQPQIILKKQLP